MEFGTHLEESLCIEYHTGSDQVLSAGVHQSRRKEVEAVCLAPCSTDRGRSYFSS